MSATPNENFKMPPFLVNNNAIHPDESDNIISEDITQPSVDDEIVTEEVNVSIELPIENVDTSVKEMITKLENNITDYISEDAIEYKVKSYANQIVDVILLNNNKENRLVSIIEQISDLKLNDENVITDSLNSKNKLYRDLLQSIEDDMSGILEKIKVFKF